MHRGGVLVQKVSVQSQLERWDNAAATVIAASRRDAGLTQTQLAEAMGWKRSVIARLETGERPLRGVYGAGACAQGEP